MGVSEPLDAYSTIVAGVAESLTSKVASVRVPKRGGESLGSAVVFTAGGVLLAKAPGGGPCIRRHGGVLRWDDDAVPGRGGGPAVGPGGAAGNRRHPRSSRARRGRRPR